MPSYAQSSLNTITAARVSGSFTDANFLVVANDAAREVLSDMDLRSTKRRTALSPNLFNSIFSYTCPSDVKAEGIIDIQPQIGRGRLADWELVPAEEFDREKNNRRYDSAGDPYNLEVAEWFGRNLVAIDERDFIKKLLISKPINDVSSVISPLDAIGDWEAFGDGTNITKDPDNFVKGSASLNWDINDDGGTTAGIFNSSLSQFDVSDYLSTGSAFVWAYASSVTNLTNYIIRIGSSASDYYSMTVTTDNESGSFVAGWNLLRFDFSGKSTTGTPDDDACDYVAIYMTKDGAKVSETDYRFDNIVMKRGNHYWVRYYSKYIWQTSGGSYIEDATTTTDLLNVDTDEYNLVILKTAELMEIHLKNFKEADRWAVKYEQKKAQYELKSPGESLVSTQQYYNLVDPINS